MGPMFVQTPVVASATVRAARVVKVVVGLILGAVCTWAWAAPSLAGVDDRGRRLPVDQVPRRVVSLTPTLTEMVCALQACDRLVGTDNHSRWPQRVRELPKLGGLEDAQVERVVALKPDVVLTATSTRVIERLESLGLRVIALEPRTLNEVQQVLDKVALVLGKPGAGASVWQAMEAQITKAAQGVPASVRGQSVYFEVASTPYAASQSSFIGEVLSRLGLRNVIPGHFGPFPAVNAELILQAHPQWIMGSAMEVALMKHRPGWARLQALSAGKVCAFEAHDIDTMMRAGPRLAQAAEAIVSCLQKGGSAGVRAVPAGSS